MPPTSEAGIIGGSALTFAELERRFASGARVAVHRAAEAPSADEIALFAVTPKGDLRIATDERPLDVSPSDTVVALAGA